MLTGRKDEADRVMGSSWRRVIPIPGTSLAGKNAAHATAPPNLAMMETEMTAYRRAICRMLMVLVAWMPFQFAQAGMIGTPNAAAATDRSTVTTFLNRTDVVSQMQALGLDPATAKDRVNAMSDTEVASLAHQIDALPAGGMSHGAKIVLVLVVIGVIVWWVAGRPGM
jgi:hypothetical protein